jgi:parallel beta-helix repeat protein
MKRAIVILSLIAASPSFAATFRYSTSNNRIYIEKGGASATLSDVKNALPNAPLDLVSSSPKIWLLRANLQISDGSVLVLHGVSIGGDVDELRIQSNNDSSGYVTVTADYGTIDIDSTKIRSWDAAVGGPDSSESNGRAYVRVRSKYASDGVTPQESHMDVANSEISYLGFEGSESYGLVWKVNVPSVSDYANVNVWGSISNSHIHHNHYAVYTFGHQDGVFSNNEIDHNSGYGLDMHDDTDNLLVDGNDVHDNGNHGIIFSKRCDHGIVRNNDSYQNVGNGIMVHRSSDDTLIENNRSHDNTDSGVAIFATWRTEVRNNTLLDNGSSGVRLSMGGANNNVHDNEIGGSGKYGFYFYKGSDTPEPGDDGRPRNNTFTHNNVHDTGSDGIKMSDADGNTFTSNTFTNVGSLFEFSTGASNTLTTNTIPSTVTLKVSGTSSVPSSLTVRPTGASQKLQLADANSTAQFRDSSRAIFDVTQSVSTVVTSSSSLMSLTSALIGTSATTVTKRPFTAKPSGTNVYVDPTTWSTNRAWQARATSASGSVAYDIGALTAGAKYVVQQGSTTIGTFTASASGHISFTVTPGTTSTLGYTATQQ